MKKRKWLAALLVVVLLVAGEAVFLACRISLYEYALSQQDENSFVSMDGRVWRAAKLYSEREFSVHPTGELAALWVKTEVKTPDEALLPWEYARLLSGDVMLRQDGSLWRVHYYVKSSVLEKASERERCLLRPFMQAAPEEAPADGGDFALWAGPNALNGSLPRSFSLRLVLKPPVGLQAEDLRACLSVRLCGTWYQVCEGTVERAEHYGEDAPAGSLALRFALIPGAAHYTPCSSVYVPGGEYRVEVYNGDALFCARPFTLLREGTAYTLIGLDR